MAILTGKHFVLCVYDKEDDFAEANLEIELDLEEREIQDILETKEEIYACYSISNEIGSKLLKQSIADTDECFIEVFSSW